MGRTIIVGSMNQDVVVAVERHPRTGETLMGGDLSQHFGGKGGNQAVAAALTDCPTMMVGCVGDDPAGREYVARLDAFGVDTSGVRVVDGVATGTALIMVNAEGDNTIVVAPGANHRVTSDDLTVLDALGEGDVVLLQLEINLDLVGEVVERSKASGALVLANLAPYTDLPQHVLDAVDTVIVNEHEFALMGESGLTHRDVLVTLGSRGSRWGDIEVAAQRIDAVDTTGAGDTYCGTLAAALAQGADRRSAMEAASEAAARCALHAGAQPDPLV